MATTSAETGPGTIPQISRTTSRKSRPALWISDGLVVTPSSRPVSARSRISFGVGGVDEEFHLGHAFRGGIRPFFSAAGTALATADERRELNRAIWAIALPSMLTNVATALFGLADLWVIGQLGQAEPQAGVELGAKFMMGLLIVFNFLRTGTIALTAQAAGRGDEEAQAATLARALGLSLAIGLVLLALKPLVVPWGMELLHARGGVAGRPASMSASAIGAGCCGWPTSP